MVENIQISNEHLPVCGQNFSISCHASLVSVILAARDSEGKSTLLRLPPWNLILPLFVNMELTVGIVASSPNLVHFIDSTLLEQS